MKLWTSSEASDVKSFHPLPAWPANQEKQPQRCSWLRLLRFPANLSAVGFALQGSKYLWFCKGCLKSNLVYFSVTPSQGCLSSQYLVYRLPQPKGRRCTSRITRQGKQLMQTVTRSLSHLGWQQPVFWWLRGQELLGHITPADSEQKFTEANWKLPSWRESCRYSWRLQHINAATCAFHSSPLKIQATLKRQAKASTYPCFGYHNCSEKTSEVAFREY